MISSQKQRDKTIKKELQWIKKQELKLLNAALRVKESTWKASLEVKIPQKVYSGLESAFCKGFSLVFDQGRIVIEKSYDKQNIQADHAIRDYAVQLKGSRKAFRQMHKQVKRSNSMNMLITAAEGIGLGALGIGMPDIVLFLSNLLKGVYETALSYGFDYESPQEQVLILKMMQTALTSGEEWISRNREVDEMLHLETLEIGEGILKHQMQDTASVFAMDMLIMKFIQGLPIVGILGGAANPVYYHKIMKYVQLKYRKRYLLKLDSSMNLH